MVADDESGAFVGFQLGDPAEFLSGGGAEWAFIRNRGGYFESGIESDVAFDGDDLGDWDWRGGFVGGVGDGDYWGIGGDFGDDHGVAICGGAGDLFSGGSGIGGVEWGIGDATACSVDDCHLDFDGGGAWGGDAFDWGKDYYL